jgi:hypothetical protein
LLLVAVVIVNALRFRPAPAQGNGQPPARSGDTNCDGKIDITDPIIVLNWLFSDGPEPCVIAQGDGCCESLRAEVAARLPLPDDIVARRGEAHFGASVQPQILLEVPEGKRFVITSLALYDICCFGPKLLSITDEQASETVEGFTDGKLTSWSTGYAFPAGSDVGLTILSGTGEPHTVPYFINGYFVAE